LAITIHIEQTPSPIRFASYKTTVFGDSVAIHICIRRGGRSPSTVSALPKTLLRPRAYGFYLFGGEELPEQRRHYDFACTNYELHLKLDLRHTEPGLSALRRKHDGVQLSRSLSQRLASGVGTGDLRWIEE